MKKEATSIAVPRAATTYKDVDYKQLEKLLKDNQLFTYLDTSLTNELIPRTTNFVEGGINSQIRTKLKLHRGMSEEHQRRLVEWYLYSRTGTPKPPRFFL